MRLLPHCPVDWRRKVVSVAQLASLTFFTVSHGFVQKLLERRDAVKVAIDPVLLVAYLGGQSASLRYVAAERACNVDIFIDGPRGGLADPHHVKDRRRVAAAHHRAGQRHDGKIVNEALQDRIATRPADAIQHDVALTDGGDEQIRRQPGQENTVIAGVETGGLEGAFKPVSEQVGDAATASEFDESKLGVDRKSTRLNSS